MGKVRTACFAGLMAWPMISVGFAVDDARSNVRNGELQVTAEVSIEFTDDVIMALETGIPIKINTEIRVYVNSNPFWDKRIATGQFSEQILHRKFPITYLVESAYPGIAGAYGRLSEALAAVGGTRQHIVKLPKDYVAHPDELHGTMRVYLDRSELPGALRMQGYFKRAWQLQSDWAEFDIQ